VNFIHKQNEPDEFTEWKKTIGSPGNSGEWDDLKNPEKENLHRSLMDEQGSVCCYCERSISSSPSHIEHIKPQSVYPDDRFNYSNLLSSCNGDGEKHCGHKKGNWFDPSLFVSPLDPDCVSYFKFTSAGEIKPTDDPHSRPAAQETIDHLNLNDPSLVDKRKKVIDGLGITDSSFSNSELITIRNHYGHRDSSGRFSQFRACIDYILGVHISSPSHP